MKVIRNFHLLCCGLAAAAVLGLSAATASAATLSLWTFETTPPPTGAGPHLASSGIFAATSAATVTTAGTVDNPAGNGSAESLSSNNWNTGEYFQFTSSSLLYQDIIVSWDQTRSSTGPATFDLAYSTDGINFTTALNDYAVLLNGGAPNASWSSVGGRQAAYTTTVDLSSIVGLDNAATLTFRLISQVSPAATGTSRVDNFLVEGSDLIIPEPTTLALAGLGVIGILTARRRG